jgi:hypothetical protein
MAMPANATADVYERLDDKAVATQVASLYSESEINALDFSPDGRDLAGASYFYSAKLHIWDWHSEKELASSFQLTASNPLVVNAIGYSRDGRYIGWCAYATPIWRLQTGDVVFQSEHKPAEGLCNAISFAPDGRSLYLALVSGPGSFTKVVARDTSSWELLWEVRSEHFFARAMATSPDGRMLAVAGFEYTDQGSRRIVKILDVATQNVIRTIEPLPSQNRDAKVASGDVTVVAWNAESTRLSVGLSGVPSDGAPAVRIYDAKNGDEVAREGAGRGTHVRGLCYTSDGKYLVVVGIGKVVEVWDGQHRQLLQEIRADPTSCAVSRDGKYLALGGSAPSLSNLNPLLAMTFPGRGKVLVYKLR